MNKLQTEDFGPSDHYLGTGTISFVPDLIYRPNDRISIQAATNKLVSDRLAQVGGTHYGNPATDVYAFSMANDLDPLQFNVVKYVTRFRKKDGIKDLRKAIHTLERLIAHEEAKK